MTNIDSHLEASNYQEIVESMVQTFSRQITDLSLLIRDKDNKISTLERIVERLRLEIEKGSRKLNLVK